MAASTCPTFHWGAIANAERFELVVYDLDALEQEAAGAQGEGAVDAGGGDVPEPLALGLELPGSVTGWTPPLDRCLPAGGRWAWSVRARTPEGLTA